MTAAPHEDLGDGVEGGELALEHGARCDPILDAARADDGRQQGALGVYRDVALDLLYGVVSGEVSGSFSLHSNNITVEITHTTIPDFFVWNGYLR